MLREKEIENLEHTIEDMHRNQEALQQFTGSFIVCGLMKM